MYDEGYQNITNIDISQTVIKAMVEKYKDKGSSFKCNSYPLEKNLNLKGRSANGHESHGVSGWDFRLCDR